MPVPGLRDSRIVTPTRDQLGEGPHWDAAAGCLTRVDIVRGLLHGYQPVEGSSWELAFDGDLSAAVPRRTGGYVLAIGHELVLREPDGKMGRLAAVETEVAHTRFNECRADAAGRLWAGTMSKERKSGTGSLYRVDPDGAIECVLTGTTISNGLGWSCDGTRMYFIDSMTQRIDVFDYDSQSGAPVERRAFARVDPADGLPDGLTVDAEDHVWVCLFGGRAIRRYAPDGVLDRHIPLVVTNPTCPAFGDDDLGTLYVTSARHRLTPAQLESEPEAGALLALAPGVAGVPGHAFAG